MSCLFPRLYQLSQTHNVPIISRIPLSSLSLSWDFGFCRNLNARDTLDMVSLFSLLDNVHINYDSIDKEGGRLSIRVYFFAYPFSKLLINNPSCSIFSPSLMIWWKAKVP